MHVVLLIATVAVASAQWSAIQEQVSQGDEIRVDSGRKRSIKGRLDSVSDTKLTVVHRGKAMEIERSQVARVYRFVSHARGKNIAVATAIGAGVGLLFGAWVYSKGDIVKGFVPFSGAVGAGVGALSNYAFGRKRNEVLVYSKY
ncbi:MAG: hypothetical protein U0Q16_09380 [Bryobacteraceae bacterium]